MDAGVRNVDPPRAFFVRRETVSVLGEDLSEFLQNVILAGEMGGADKCPGLSSRGDPALLLTRNQM